MTKGKRMRMIVEQRGRMLDPKASAAVLAEVSARLRAKQELPKRVIRMNGFAPERRSIERAMYAVEDRIVRALWVLSRLPNDRGINFARRNGIDYMQDREDRFANAVAAGGKWEQMRPQPSSPSGREIDAMHEPLDWLRYLDRSQARLLSAGAQSKKGDVDRNISWNRVKARMPEFDGLTVVTLHRRYRQALREIVTELTIANPDNMK